MRDSLKGFVERFLVAALPLERRRARLGGRLLVLAFHNVIASPAEAGLDRSLHLSLDRLRELLDALAPTHRFVALDEGLTPVPTADSRPAVALTFDDAYAGALQLALPLLAERSIPATVFVVPGRLGHAGMWWDVLSSSAGGLTGGERARALVQGRGAHEAVMAMGATLGWRAREAPAASRLGSLEEVRWALTLPGITVGSHSWSHPNLTRLDDAALHEELARPQAWLLAEAGPAYRPWLAFPYGRSDARVASAARAAGYDAAFRVTGGWTDAPPADRHAAARLNVPAGLSADGIRLRGAGVFC